MNKKLAAALSGGAVLVLALSGCSDDSDNKVNDWAKKVCDQVQPQLQKIANANASIQQQTADNSKPADVQKTDSAAFQQISQAYKALGAAVDSAGRAAGRRRRDHAEGGREGAQRLLRGVRGSEDKVDALDTKDQAKFADGLKGIADELNKISTNGDQALKKLQSGEVGAAMAKQKGCQKPTASAGPASPRDPRRRTRVAATPSQPVGVAEQQKA